MHEKRAPTFADFNKGDLLFTEEELKKAIDDSLRKKQYFIKYNYKTKNSGKNVTSSERIH